MSFDQKIIPHLEALAAVLLAQKMYPRLQMVASLLAVFSGGGWQRLGDDEREALVKELDDAFHVRAWDDWDIRDTTVSKIRELIFAEQKGLRTKSG
jgi:hypothetical protein